MFEFAQRFNFQSQASRYIIGGNRTSESRYDHLDFPISSILNFTHLDTLWTAIGHPSQKIWSLAFSYSFDFKFQASRHIMGGHRTSESKDMDVWICPELPLSISSVFIYYKWQLYIQVKRYGVWIFQELPFSISSVSIYNGRKSAIRVKRYGCLNLPRGSIFNLKRLDTLLEANRHPNQDMTVWICLNLPFEISSVLIHYGRQSNIRVKRYYRLNLPRSSVLNLKHLNTL